MVAGLRHVGLRRSLHDWGDVMADYIGSRYQLLTVRELEADLASLEVALQAKRAEEAADMIDGAL
jgi:hypothetical protein